MTRIMEMTRISLAHTGHGGARTGRKMRPAVRTERVAAHARGAPPTPAPDRRPPQTPHADSEMTRITETARMSLAKRGAPPRPPPPRVRAVSRPIAAQISESLSESFSESLSGRFPAHHRGHFRVIIRVIFLSAKSQNPALGNSRRPAKAPGADHGMA